MLEMAPPLALLLLPLSLGLPHPEERVQAEGLEEDGTWMNQLGCTILYDEDYWGGDLPGYSGLQGLTVEACAKLCYRVPACQLWGWWGNACWLKNTNVQRTPYKGNRAGQKICGSEVVEDGNTAKVTQQDKEFHHEDSIDQEDEYPDALKMKKKYCMRYINSIHLEDENADAVGKKRKMHCIEYIRYQNSQAENSGEYLHQSTPVCGPNREGLWDEFEVLYPDLS